jgi:CubicO group peptidase (beta-lactamase class C family)
MNPSRQTAVEHSLRGAITFANAPNPTYDVGARMAHYGVPGMSVAVIEHGDVQWAAGYGACYADGPAVEPTTLFQAASISKVVNALGVLALWQRGLFDLDVPINSLLKTWQIAGRNRDWADGVTARRLLSHTAGTGVSGFEGYVPGLPLPSTVEVLDGSPPATSEPVTIETAPGSAFHYSGGGTTILQLLVEELTDQPYSSAMAELVLEPFGMVDSRFEQPLADDRFARAAHGHTVGRELYAGGMRVFPEQAAAGLWTTALDLAQLVIAIQQTANGALTDVIDADTAASMLRPVDSGPHGLGPQVLGVGAGRRFGHNGTNRGFCSQIEGFLDHRSGVVIMTNGDGGNSLLGDVRRGVADVYGWEGFEGTTITTVEVPSDQLERLTGRYDGPFDLAMRLIHLDGQLFSPSPYGRRVLHALSGDRFLDEETGAELVFVATGDAIVARVMVDGNEIYSYTKLP